MCLQLLPPLSCPLAWQCPCTDVWVAIPAAGSSSTGALSQPDSPKPPYFSVPAARGTRGAAGEHQDHVAAGEPLQPELRLLEPRDETRPPPGAGLRRETWGACSCLCASSCSERGPSPSLGGCGSPGTSPRGKTHERDWAGAAGTRGRAPRAATTSGRPRRVPRAARAGGRGEARQGAWLSERACSNWRGRGYEWRGRGYE